jgi:hypothetical protein
MLTDDMKRQSLLAPCLPLRFLIQSETRAKSRHQMQGFSDSAMFYRLHDLFWTLGEADALALLSNDERLVVREFDLLFDSMPWRIIPSHPHVSELPDDDLTPLIPAAERLVRMLKRAASRQRFEWLHRLCGFFRVSHARAA